MSPRPHTSHFLLSVLFLGLFVVTIGIGTASSSTGSEVFRGFTGHISKQILQDKQAFYIAQTCTTYFYKNFKKPRQPQVERIAYHPASEPLMDFDCATRYPKGLDEAREAFSHTQQTLSLSLTFFEFALVGDKNDDHHYAGIELRDVMESFGVSFEDHLPSAQYVMHLNNFFDSVMNKREIEALTNSMSELLSKGYRFTPADQDALNKVLN